jgi:hypothetical protein
MSEAIDVEVAALVHNLCEEISIMVDDHDTMGRELSLARQLILSVVIGLTKRLTLADPLLDMRDDDAAR